MNDITNQQILQHKAWAMHQFLVSLRKQVDEE